MCHVYQMTGATDGVSPVHTCFSLWSWNIIQSAGNGWLGQNQVVGCFFQINLRHRECEWWSHIFYWVSVHQVIRCVGLQVHVA